MSQRKVIKHEGVLKLANFEIPCYVLEDGTRLLSGRGMQSALNMVDVDEDSTPTSGARLKRYLAQKSLNPFIFKDKSLVHFDPIICYLGDKKINGYEATILADICDAFLEARKHIKLSARQEVIAAQCEILIRGFARVGIIALVDEATGYQHEREKDALQVILKAYISEELLAWQKRFPDEFYKEIFRLNNWDFTVNGIQNRPGVIGTWTNKLVYNQLPKAVLLELKRRTPKSETGNYTARFHQSLTMDTGSPHLEKQLVSVITLMNVSKDWNEFKRFFNKKFGQQEIEFDSYEASKTTPNVNLSFGQAIGKMINNV